MVAADRESGAMAVHINGPLVAALMRAYNDGPRDHVVAITRDGAVAVAPGPVRECVWQCSPSERRGNMLSFDDALKLLIALKASGAFETR
jgi:hypothetical protein